MFCIPIQQAYRLIYQPIAVCFTPAWALAWPLTKDAYTLCSTEGPEVELFEWRTISEERISVRRIDAGWSVSIDGDEIMTHNDPQIVASFASFLTATVPFILCAPYNLHEYIPTLDAAVMRIVWQYRFDTPHPLPVIAIGRATQTHLASWSEMGWEVGWCVDLSQYGLEGTLSVQSGTETEPAYLETSTTFQQFHNITDLTRWIRQAQ